tara:strand:+ start:6393 stop:7358 length:966 start_codon:yes stop_codon:yes gene_type:complete
MAVSRKTTSQSQLVGNPVPIPESRSYIDPSQIAAKKDQLLHIVHIPTSKTVGMYAYITNFQDSYQSNWTREAVYGRMDPLCGYQNTQRVITLGWQLVSADLREARVNYNKVKRLIQMLYPTYKKLGSYRVIGSPPLIAIKHVQLISSIGNALSERFSGYLIGTLDGLSNQPDFSVGVYEDGNGIYPKLINLSFNFHVLHDYDLGWDGGTAEVINPTVPGNVSNNPELNEEAPTETPAPVPKDNDSSPEAPVAEPEDDLGNQSDADKEEGGALPGEGESNDVPVIIEDSDDIGFPETELPEQDTGGPETPRGEVIITLPPKA